MKHSCPPGKCIEGFQRTRRWQNFDYTFFYIYRFVQETELALGLLCRELPSFGEQGRKALEDGGERRGGILSRTSTNESRQGDLKGVCAWARRNAIFAFRFPAQMGLYRFVEDSVKEKRNNNGNEVFISGSVCLLPLPGIKHIFNFFPQARCWATI